MQLFQNVDSQAGNQGMKWPIWQVVTLETQEDRLNNVNISLSWNFKLELLMLTGSNTTTDS